MEQTYKKGTDHWAAKITPEIVRTIRARRAAGESCKELGEEYKLHHQTVYKIVKRLRWKEVE